MLKEVIDLQTNAVTKLVNLLPTKEELTFKAPTGSGKTYMMADFMNRIIENDKDVVFLVSTLSKGDLATQNYEKFIEYSKSGKFTNLKPYLINTEIFSEERLYIPTDYNVYLLPRDLYKKGAKLMQGPMGNFLLNLTLDKDFRGLGKHIFLIKDECHVATNNLDSLPKKTFKKIINFSATPKLNRGQIPDVEITDAEAVNAKLIKRIEIGEDDASIGDAICKFEEIKTEYQNLLGINPCLIIQISNKDKADDELKNKIMPELNKAEHQDLKYMVIVNNPKQCDTNDAIKNKNLPIEKWRDYAKSSTIDIIIFKMVISEGWDIPRACMLYQVRDTQSEQLDEQVMGRVRRNPRLLDFEKLNSEAQELATTAWIWGIVPKDKRKTFNVKLFDEPSDITNNIRLYTTKLLPLSKKKDFDIVKFIKNQPTSVTHSSIFSLYRKLYRADEDVKLMCYQYADSYKKWFEFNENINKIINENNQYICDYTKSMKINSDENGNPITVSFPNNSMYVDNGNNKHIGSWVWKRQDGNDNFSFDSEAESAWAEILKDLCSDDNPQTGERIIKRVVVGKKNPKAGAMDMFGNVEPEKLNSEIKYLWGKNYIINSEIKYEYYLNGLHLSYPDFIMEDSYGRIHIFEVKSVNKSNDNVIDEEEYDKKILALKNCYKRASFLTKHIFYLPVLVGENWQITQFFDGKESILTKSQFKDFLLTNN